MVELLKKFSKYFKTNASSIMVLLFLVIFSLFHIRLVSNTFYIDHNNNFYSTGEGYGDVPLHLTQIAHFAFSSSINTNEPIYFGVQMNYHFFFNLIRGLILAFTDSWNLAVVWPIILLVAFNIFLLFKVLDHILKNKYLSILSLLIFYLGPNLSWINSILEEKGIFLTQMGATYPLQNIAFGSPLVLVFTHQHTAIFGFTLFLIFIYSIIRLRDCNHWFYWSIAILSLGFLPLSHIHSFFAAVVFLLATIAVSIFQKKYSFFKKVLIIGFSSFIITIPQILYLLSSKVGDGSFIKFRVGWMVGEGMGGVIFSGAKQTFLSLPFLNFTGINFGLILPVFIVSLIFLSIYLYRTKPKQKEETFFVIIFGLAGLVLFFMGQLIKFQPWDFDNNKVFVYFLLFSSPVVIWFLYKFQEERPYLRNIILILFTSISIATGLLYSTDRFITKKNNLPMIFSRDAVRVADYVRVNIPENSLILTSSTHLNLVSSLAGRPVLVGYPGWLWTRGINYGERLRDIEEFYKNPQSDSKIFVKYPISYILFDDFVKYDYGTKQDDLENLFEKVFESGSYALYSIKK